MRLVDPSKMEALSYARHKYCKLPSILIALPDSIRDNG
jgi:hypothetical protein